MKEVFVFVAGGTPQVITETIYALSQRKPPVHPDEIHIITTSKGKERILESLLKHGILEKMAEEYNLPPIPLRTENIIVVMDEEGNELQDIRNEKDNETVANLITDFIREKTKDPTIRLHCSLAGGRKTMGFYLGSALQLFGRPWDKLYHVLVTPEFESNPEFFYKPKEPKVLEVYFPDGSRRRVSTECAEVELAELPFLRLSDKLSLRGKTFKELIISGQKEIDLFLRQRELKVNLEKREVLIGELQVKLTPVQLLLYTALLRRKLEHCLHPERLHCLDCVQCFPTIPELVREESLKRMGRDYSRIYMGKDYKAEELLARWKKGSVYEQFRQYFAKINKVIRSSLTEIQLADYYAVTSIRQYGATKYGVRLDKEKIRVE